MSLADLRIAVIGCGRMGQTRAAGIAAAGAQLDFVADIAAERRDELAQRYPGCRAIADAGELDYSQLDAVFVCTPPSQRGRVEMEALHHGVAILVEKPIGLSSGSLAILAAGLTRTPVPTAVGYMNRYRASVQRARSLLREESVLGFSANWLVGRYDVPWWGQKSGSGGPVNEQATHIIDLARYLVGEIVEVQALGKSLAGASELIGSATIGLRFASGILGSFLYSCEAKQKMIRMQMYTVDQTVVLNDWDFRWGDEAPAAVDRNQIFADETRAFLDDVLAFRRGTTPASPAVLCNYHDALATQRAVDAVHEALAIGGVVTLPPAPVVPLRAGAI